MSEKHPKKGHGHKKLEPHERKKQSAEAKRRLLPLLEKATTHEEVAALKPELKKAGLGEAANLKMNHLKGLETKITKTAKEGVSKIAKEDPKKAEEVKKETDKITKIAEEEVKTADTKIEAVVTEEDKKTTENTEEKKLSIEDQIAELMIDMPEKNIEKLNENEEFFKSELIDPKNQEPEIVEEIKKQLENIEKIKVLHAETAKQAEVIKKPDPEELKKKVEAQEALLVKTQKEFFDAQKNKPKKPGWLSFGGKAEYEKELAKWEKNLKEKESAYTSAKNEHVKNFLENGDRAGAQNFLVQQLELKKQNNLENASFSERMKNSISKGIKSWEEIGTNPEDSKTKQILKKMGKTIIAVGVIGGASAAIVSSAAALGVGTASALAGGTAAYLTRRVAMAVGFSTTINLVPDKVKPFIATAMAFTSVAGVTGYGVSKLSGFATKKWLSEEAITKKSGETMETLSKKKLNLDTLDADIKKMEEELIQVTKEAEKKRTYRRLLAATTALVAGVAVMEISGHISDENKAEEEAKQNEEQEQEKAEQDKKLEEQEKKEAEENKQEKTTTENTESKTVNQDAVVHKGEGIEHALQRQGLSGHEAHLLAIKEGYVDGDGNEVRVAVADRVAYEVHNENGNISVEEKFLNEDGTWESKEIHHQGDKFETATEKYEYSHNNNEGTDTESNTSTNIDSGDDKIIPPEHVNPDENSQNDEKIIAPEHVNKALEATNTENTPNEEETSPENNTNITEFNLTPEQLEKVDNLYEDNAKQLFGGDSLRWEKMEIRPAENFVSMNTGELEDPQAIQFVEHIQHLQEITELHPIEETPLTEAETVGEFEIRALQLLESQDRLGEAKIENEDVSTSNETVVDGPQLHHLEFSNSDHIISHEGLQMQFIYDENGKITDVDVDGDGSHEGPNPYSNESELAKLDPQTRLEADSEIFKMQVNAQFLDQIPKDTNEYKFIHDQVVEMQKDIVKEYGNVINPEKIEK